MAKRESGGDSHMTQFLEFSDRRFKIVMINTLRVLMEKVGNLQGR